MPLPQVLILFNEPVLPPDHPDAAAEYTNLEIVATVRNALTEYGYGVRTLGVGRDVRPLLATLHTNRPDVVYNLFEGLADQSHTEYTVAGLLEWANVPYTGSPPEALALARNKSQTKHLMQGAGLPTPAFFTVHDPREVPPCRLGWPIIVKPALQDASVGIEQASVVTSQAQLQQRVAFVLERFGPPALVERFVFGRELQISVIEDPDEPNQLVLLPLSELMFKDPDPALWPIFTYEAKWRDGHREFVNTELRFPVALGPELYDSITRIARRAYRLIGCRDVARLDVRLTATGKPYILEVNPNPFLRCYALTRGLREMGRDYEKFLVGLVRLALARPVGRSTSALSA